MNISEAHRRRFRAMQWVGCIACRLDGRPGEPADVHHLLSGGRRIGHHATIPLCPWHHRGIANEGARAAESMRGPSLARSKRAFVERYGTEEELRETVDRMLEMIGV